MDLWSPRYPYLTGGIVLVGALTVGALIVRAFILFGRSKPLLKSIIVIPIVAVIVLVYLNLSQMRAAETEMGKLLSGDLAVGLRGLTISEQQREVLCTDHEVLQYISSSMRLATANNPLADTIYRARFDFDDGRTFTATVYFQHDGFSISMPSRAGDEDIPTDQIKFRTPMPNKIMVMLDFLSAPWQQVSGTRLVLEDGKPVRREHDSALVPK